MPRKGSTAEVAEGYETISAAFSLTIMGSQSYQYTLDIMSKLTTELKNRFDIVTDTEDSEQNILVRLSLTDGLNKANVTFYGTGKCMVQGRDSDLLTSINQILASSNLQANTTVQEQKVKIDETEIYKSKEVIIGFDEAGKGEPAGPLVIAAVALRKEQLEKFKSLKSDVKSLNLQELNYYCGLMKREGISFKYNIVPSIKITNSPVNLNRLLDAEYVSLAREFSGVLSTGHFIAIDDYGIKDDLTEYLKSIGESHNVEYIAENKIDEQITAAKLASVVARQIRLTKINEIQRRNVLEKDGKKYSIGKGANNPEFIAWLKTFRSLYPTLDFPDFVRLGWKNVREVEEQCPKKAVNLLVECPSCKEKVSLLLGIYDKPADRVRYYCSMCRQEIIAEYLAGVDFPRTICDTSALVAGWLSKDLRASNSVFEGTRLIVPHKVLDEIDTIGLSKKRGALNEMTMLRELSNRKKIVIQHEDYEVSDPFDTDAKLYGTLAKRNGCVFIAGDNNLADNAHFRDGAFVLKIVFHPNKILKKE